jgi:TolB protein
LKVTASSLLLWLLALAFVNHASAELTIRITQGIEGALPIAVVPLANEGGVEPPEDIAAVIRENLAGSGRFRSVPVASMPEQPSNPGDVRYPLWRSAGADNLVLGTVSRTADGGYQVQVQLLDAYQGTQIEVYAYKVAADGLRRLAHFLSDRIYERLTGEKGAFNTRIAYITTTGSGESKRYSLMVADADGYNPQSVLRSRDPLLSPSWSPDGQSLAYVSFEAGQPQIFVQNVFTGERKIVSSFKGINGAPSWSPDGRQLALVLSRDGNPEIYAYNLATENLLRVTRNTAIDTEPVWADDGRTIVFTSDRGGGPQLYEIAVGGGSAQRLTFEGSYNARPSISPDGRKIAMVHRTNDDYRIAVLDRDTGLLQVLTDGALDESPSFAPNGSTVLYASSAGPREVLKTVSVDGRIKKTLQLREGDVREPAWSPYTG